MLPSNLSVKESNSKALALEILKIQVVCFDTAVEEFVDNENKNPFNSCL